MYVLPLVKECALLLFETVCDLCIFCSKHFSLIDMQRMPKNGSDHFATLTHFSLRKDLQKEQDPPKADKEEMAEARELASQPVKH